MKLAGCLLGMSMGLGAAATGTAGAQNPPMEHHVHKTAVPSTSLNVTANGKTLTFSLADLQAMPQRQLTVHNGHTQTDEMYTGVSLSDLLQKTGITTEGEGAKKVYHSYVRAEGTDKYYVIFSASELEQTLRTGDSIVALSVDGKPLTEDGAFKMVDSGEKKPARWVRNLASLTVVTVD